MALIVAGVLALLGSFVVTAPAQAGYYGESDYGSSPCSYRCGYSPYRYRYAPRYYDRGCSACGCYRHCYSGSRPGLVYERRYREREYREREYVERRYGWPEHHYRRHYGYYPYGGYRSYERPFPYGYGGVRGWRTPYGYRYEPSSYRYEEEAPRPPAPVWGGSGYETVPYGYERSGWNADPSEREDRALRAVPYDVEDVSRPLPAGPLGMLASGIVGILNIGSR